MNNNPRPLMHDHLETLPPEKLASLLTDSPATTWPATEAAAILRHQLAAPLLPDLASPPGAEPARLEALLQNRPFTQNFAAQLTAITPALELLIAIKNFARHANTIPDHPLGGVPAAILYHAAIAAAILRCQTRITHLSDDDLREAFTWAVDQPSAEPLHFLFRAALADPALPSPVVRSPTP